MVHQRSELFAGSGPQSHIQPTYRQFNHKNMGATLKKYIWVIGLICVVIISYLLAKITTLYIEGYFPNVVITTSGPTETKTTTAQPKAKAVNIDVILKRNFFDASETPIDSIIVSDDQQDTQISTTSDEAVETKLNIKLISTIAVGNGKNEFSSCVVDANRIKDTYFIGGKKSFAPGTKLVRILPKRVEFINNGQLEYVKLEEFAKNINLTKKPVLNTDTGIKKITRTEDSTDESIVREGDSFQIARAEVEAALANMSKLYTDIRGVPFFDNGVAKGFKILSVKRGSLFEKLGIRRGDILKSVNGRTLDIQSGFETFKSLRTETEFALEIERRGESLSYKYEII